MDKRVRAIFPGSEEVRKLLGSLFTRAAFITRYTDASPYGVGAV